MGTLNLVNERRSKIEIQLPHFQRRIQATAIQKWWKTEENGVLFSLNNNNISQWNKQRHERLIA